LCVFNCIDQEVSKPGEQAASEHDAVKSAGEAATESKEAAPST
jgi:hypothetical protein